MATLTENDFEQIRRHGISRDEIARQLEHFKNGFPYLRLWAAAGAGRGILQPTAHECDAAIEAWQTYLNAQGRRVVKFVPASGAASRMFKDLFAFLDAPYQEPTTPFEKKFFDEIHHFAFFSELDAACRRIEGNTTGGGVEALLAAGQYKAVVGALLNAPGLNYGHLPKGLLAFHNYHGRARTPLEEHLVEGALYAADHAGTVHVHFTVSPEHRALFEDLASQSAAQLGPVYGVTFDISFSEQKPSTDTLAVQPNNEPFRLADGHLLFRPGGHGALLENLNDLGADVVFIKNIDNVVPDRLKASTVKYKKLLAGMLVSLQQQAFAYLEKLESGRYTMDEVREMLQFVQKKLCCKNPETKMLEDTELAIYVRSKLNRPMRVCGMVRNVGEPGGGPFLAYAPDGTIQLQILESSQINMSDPEAVAMFKGGTYFNPVDLVCAVKDYRGRPFNLPDYVDPQTGFISHKSKDGKELKALERPGLWNGAMSNWNTVFVEVPLDTFNPVKTVNDLLREQHQ